MTAAQRRVRFATSASEPSSPLQLTPSLTEALLGVVDADGCLSTTTISHFAVSTACTLLLSPSPPPHCDRSTDDGSGDSGDSSLVVDDGTSSHSVSSTDSAADSASSSSSSSVSSTNVSSSGATRNSSSCGSPLAWPALGEVLSSPIAVLLRGQSTSYAPWDGYEVEDRAALTQLTPEHRSVLAAVEVRHSLRSLPYYHGLLTLRAAAELLMAPGVGTGTFLLHFCEHAVGGGADTVGGGYLPEQQSLVDMVRMTLSITAGDAAAVHIPLQMGVLGIHLGQRAFASAAEVVQHYRQYALPAETQPVAAANRLLLRGYLPPLVDEVPPLVAKDEVRHEKPEVRQVASCAQTASRSNDVFNLPSRFLNEV